jgi:hypothetical protein
LGLTTGDLLDTDVGKLLLLFVKDLDELGLVLVAEFVSFDGSLFIQHFAISFVSTQFMTPSSSINRKS